MPIDQHIINGAFLGKGRGRHPKQEVVQATLAINLKSLKDDSVQPHCDVFGQLPLISYCFMAEHFQLIISLLSEKIISFESLWCCYLGINCNHSSDAKYWHFVTIIKVAFCSLCVQHYFLHSTDCVSSKLHSLWHLPWRALLTRPLKSEAQCGVTCVVTLQMMQVSSLTSVSENPPARTELPDWQEAEEEEKEEKEEAEACNYALRDTGSAAARCNETRSEIAGR